ncbi:hypothetical protein BpHYR1_019905, partial [Brachionus plicatilis]
ALARQIASLVILSYSPKINPISPAINKVLIFNRVNFLGLKQLVVPQSLKKDSLEISHENLTCAHLGDAKTLTKLSNRLY